MAEINRLKILAFILFMFLFRFLFGLYCPPVTDASDYLQTYLIGLKAYTTGTWPAYGPDVQGPETSFRTQIPGALEGLLVSIPLRLWPDPASPYLFLNLLTFPALTLLGWYICRRLPGFPPWAVLTWLYLAPWMTHYSTQVINPSYAFPGSVLFFIGFMETLPSLSLGLIPPDRANLMMGFGLFWVMQLHMSWAAFIPFLLFSLYAQAKKGRFGRSFLFTFLGSLPLLALLLPTYGAYGFSTGKDVHGFLSAFNSANALDLFGTLARTLALASFEIPRFIGLNTHDRIGYLLESPWLAPPGFFLWGCFFLQPLAMLWLWFRRDHPRKDWTGVRALMAAAFGLLYGCFLFTPDMAASFRILLLFPPVMIYSFYCWDYLDQRGGAWRLLGVLFLLSVILFQAGYTLKSFRAGNCLYLQQRERIGAAIEAKDYRILGERRPGSLY